MLYIGVVSNTHGIKGEIKILSDFLFKESVFKKGIKLYIGKDKKEVIITSYRPHKNFDMVTLDGYNSINDVLDFKGSYVYVNRSDIKINGFLKEDIIGFTVIDNDKKIGEVTNLTTSKQQLLEIDNKHLIPFVDEFIKTVDLENKKIIVSLIEGLINED